MPSVYTQTDRRRTGGNQGRRRRPRVPRIRFRKGTAISSMRRGKSRNQNVIKLSTLSRKTENLSISFREQFDFQNMGYDAGSSPCLIRANLNNPVAGGPVPPPQEHNNIVVGNLKTGSTDPIFQRSSYNDKLNLSDRLSEYFEEYRTCVVTSSEVTFNVRPKLNQVSGIGFINNAVSIVPYQSLVTTGQHPDGNDGKPIGPSEVLKVTAPTATGELYVWCVRQQGLGQLYDSTDGVVPLSTLKQGIPGVRMSKLNITPNSTKGVTFKIKYTPKTQYEIKDWKDKKEALQVLNAVSGAPDKKAYAYLGIGARINGKDPSPPGATPTSSAYMANCVVEINTKYNLNFSERKNVDGNNEPVPVSVHRSDL